MHLVCFPAQSAYLLPLQTHAVPAKSVAPELVRPLLANPSEPSIEHSYVHIADDRKLSECSLSVRMLRGCAGAD